MEDFNVMEHKLVPSHYLLSEKETQELFKKYNLTLDILPKILKNDPAIKILERIHDDIPVGSVVKIVRESITAGETVNYRLVIGKKG